MRYEFDMTTPDEISSGSLFQPAISHAADQPC
jgi:hypothetical protein